MDGAASQKSWVPCFVLGTHPRLLLGPQGALGWGALGHLLPRALSFSAIRERSPCFLEFSATTEPGSVDPRPLWSLMPQTCVF